MNDFAIRLFLVGGVLATALLVVWLLRSRSRTSSRVVRRSGLAPGVYFFSSSTCADCSPVRELLIDRLGAGGFVEFSWESNRDLLNSLNIDVVPSTMVVEESGLGTLWTGAPESMFSTVDP